MEVSVLEIEMEIASIKQDKLLKSSLDLNGLGDHSSDEVPATLPEINPEIPTLNTAKTSDEELNRICEYETKLKELEDNLNLMWECNKDIKTAFEAEKVSLNQQLRNTREELDETKLTLNEKTEELQEYRLKYLRAEQQAEELRRQLDVIEYDNRQVTDQIHMEIHKMKLQFQEKLQELTPLPDVLKCTQLQLQEARELQQFFEQNSQALGLELRDVQEKVPILGFVLKLLAFTEFKNNNKLIGCSAELNKEKREKTEKGEKNRTIQEKINAHIEELMQEAVALRAENARLEEMHLTSDKSLQDKIKQCDQLEKQSIMWQEDYNHSLCIQRERIEGMRKSYQVQLSDLETQLIRSRALCSCVYKERDEVRQNLMQQINSTTENFELAEVRLRGLQAQVAMLKSKCSYAMGRYAIDDDDITSN